MGVFRNRHEGNIVIKIQIEQLPLLGRCINVLHRHSAARKRKPEKVWLKQVKVYLMQ